MSVTGDKSDLAIEMILRPPTLANEVLPPGTHADGINQDVAMAAPSVARTLPVALVLEGVDALAGPADIRARRRHAYPDAVAIAPRGGGEGAHPRR